ncbi:hypothetical protein [Staphylococcus pasteuri]|uniref:hypothetical protein n=1 Tax=Staphylococcus pasteuri TaxID=45972 RepID=UPI0003C0B55D|nr:hypothetical protein [Staphylococcus pasteuri]AGZ24990.1 hypothetical protein STP1_0679 [Staphylococcus pasteuri SP1]
MYLYDEELGNIHLNLDKPQEELTDEEKQEILNFIKSESKRADEQHRKVMESKITERTKL